jgi:tRNA(adenine34) deaminase
MQDDAGVQEALDDHYMGLAIEQARAAAMLLEVPIGAVVVCDGEVVGRACNRREMDHDPAAHAEFLAIEQAARKLGRWRLTGCTVYVTIEPCPMCAGLMYQARISRCVYGAADPKAGALGSLYRLNEDTRLNHTFEVASGVRERECAALLRHFFAERRNS